MPRSSTMLRLASVATLATIVSALVFAPVAALAADPESPRELRFPSSPGRETGGNRPFRRVDVGQLPAPSGTASGRRHERLARPATATPRASDVSAAPDPVEVTSTAHPAAAEPESWAGLAFDPTPPPATNAEPPDPFVAAGPDHVFQAVNTTIEIRERSGAPETAVTVDLFNFFGLDFVYEFPTDVQVFDPRVIYDSLHGRWIVIEASYDCFPTPDSTSGTGYIDLAISDTADPTATWGVLSIAFPGALPDYPGIGTSTDKVVLSSNVFELVDLTPGDDMDASCDTGPFLTTELDVIGWAQLLGSGAIDVDFLYGDDTWPAAGSFPNTFFSWRPAAQAPATSTTVFAVAERDDEGVEFARITGLPANGTTAISRVNLSQDTIDQIAPFALPPAPSQPGSPATIANAVDARPTDAIWQDNRLAWVSTYPCDPLGGATETRDCVRVSEVSTTPATPTRIQDFYIAEDGADHYMGGIAYAGNGDMHVVWTRSSSTAGQYPSSMAAYQLAGDGPNELTVPDQIAAGTGTYPGTRWGDYVGLAQDPQVPNAVWQANEHSAGSSWWATRVSQLQTGGTTFVPITPVRVLDTRPGIGTGLAGAFSHGTARSWTVAGFAPIPANAIAVTGNLTVTNQTAAGYVSVTPAPVSDPKTSTINFPLGDTRANNLTVQLNTDGKASATYRASAGKTAHLIFDVTGYFVAGAAQAEYKTVTPTRALDTRAGIEIGLAGAFQKDVPRELSFDPDLVPSAAVAITGNLTVVGQTGAGFLSITPASSASPTTSNLNFPLGDTRANGFVAPLDAEDDVWIVYKTTAGGARSAHVLLDVTGYFLDDPSGLQFFPLNPGRIMDTRSVPLSGLDGFFTTGTPRRLVVGDHWGVPSTAGAISGNLTVVGQNAPGFVSITLTSESNPTTSNLNFPVGDVRANGVMVPVFDGSDIWLVYKTTATGKRTHLILDVSGYFD